MTLRSAGRHRIATIPLLIAALATGSAAAFGSATDHATGAASSGHRSTLSGCVASDARVRNGAASHGADPNTVTAAESRAAEAALNKRLAARTSSATPSAITIEVYVHVITKKNGDGNVSDARIARQIAVLNQAYAGGGQSASTPFSFKLARTDRTANNDWYNWSYPGSNDADMDDRQAKSALHQGDFGDLNLYLANLSDNLLGYATFPWFNKLRRDGVVLLNESLPGGSATPYNLGDTATHEVGHWLGLFHTFENGCKNPGDQVADTPYQANGDNIFQCDEALDTCPASGKDPVHNYMSYGDDPCLDRFTTGQASRMTQVWQAFRSDQAQP